MKGWEIALVALLALALVIPIGAVASENRAGPQVTVVIQFGNGEVLSANVVLPLDNRTALKATELACENLSLGFHYTWYSGMGGLVDKIGWEQNNWPGATWHLYVMENNSEGWVLSDRGASSVTMNESDAIAWLYVEDNSNFVPLENLSTVPGHYSSSIMYRVNENGTAYYQQEMRGNETLWSFTGNSQYGGFYSTPAVAYGMIFAADDSGIYAIGPGGVELWNNSLGGTYQSSPAVLGNLVYIGTKDGYVRAFYVENGTLAWERKISSNSIASSPRVDVIGGRKMVIIGTYESSAPWGKLYAFNAENGEEIWNVTLDDGVYLGAPAINDGKIIVPLAGRYNASTYRFEAPYGIACVNESDGKLLWNITTVGAAKYSPIIADSMIYAPAGSKLLALNLSGRVVWNITLNGSVSSPAYHRNIYVGTTSGNVYAISTNGTVLWNVSVDGPVQSGVIVAGDSIVATTNQQNASVYILSGDNGTVIQEIRNGNFSWLLAAPVIYDSMLIVASGSDRVLALGTEQQIINETTVQNPYLGENIEIRVRGEAYQAFLYYRNSTDSEFMAVAMNYDASSGEYVGYIPAQHSPCVVQYYVLLYHTDGSTSQSEVQEITVAEPVPELSALLFPLLAIAVLFAWRKL